MGVLYNKNIRELATLKWLTRGTTRGTYSSVVSYVDVCTVQQQTIHATVRYRYRYRYGCTMTRGRPRRQLHAYTESVAAVVVTVTLIVTSAALLQAM